MSEQLQSGTHCPSFEDLYEIYATESEGNGHSLFLNRLRQLAVPGEVIATLESFTTSIGYLQYYVLLEYMLRKTYIYSNQIQKDSDVKSVCHDEQISSDEAFSRLKSLIGPSIHPEVRAALTHVAKHCSSDRNVIGHMQGLILYIEQLEMTAQDAKILRTGHKGMSLGLNEVSDFVRTVRSFSEFLDQCSVTCEDYDLYTKLRGEFSKEIHALSRKISVMEHLSDIDRDGLDGSQLKHYLALVDSFNR